MNSPRVQFNVPGRQAIGRGVNLAGGDGNDVPDFTTLSSEAYVKIISLTPIHPDHDLNNNKIVNLIPSTSSCSKPPSSGPGDHIVDQQLGNTASEIMKDEEEDCLEAMRKVLADMDRTTSAAAFAKHNVVVSASAHSSSNAKSHQQQLPSTATLTTKSKSDMTPIEKREVAINKLRELLYERFRVHVPISSEDLSAQLQHTLQEEQCVEHRFLHHTATTAARRKVVAKHKKLLKMHPHRTATALSSHGRSLEDIISDEEDEDLKTMTEYSQKLHSLLQKQRAARNRHLHPPPAEGTTQASSLLQRIHKKAVRARAERVGAEAAKDSENRRMMKIIVPDGGAQPKPLFSALGGFQASIGAPRSEEGDESTRGGGTANPPSSPHNVGIKGGVCNITSSSATTTEIYSARQTAQQRIQTWNRHNSPKMSRVNIETGCCDLAGETILAGASQTLSPKVKLERRLQSSSPLRSPSRSPKRRVPLDGICIATPTTATLQAPGGTSGDTSTTQPVMNATDVNTTAHNPSDQASPMTKSPSNHKHSAVKFSLIGEGVDDEALSKNFVPSPPRQSNLNRSQHKSSSAREATVDLSHEHSISNLFGDGYFTNNNNSSATAASQLLLSGVSGTVKSPSTASKSPKKSEHGTEGATAGATTSPTTNQNNKPALLIQSLTATKKRTKSVTEGIELLTDKEYARMLGLGSAKAMRAFLEEDAGAYMAVPSTLLQTRSQRYKIEKGSTAATRGRGEQYEEKKENNTNHFHGGGTRHLNLDCSLNPPVEAVEGEQYDETGRASEQNLLRTTTSPLQMDVSCTVNLLSQNHSLSYDGAYKDINSPARPPPRSFPRPPTLLPPASPHRRQLVNPSTAASTDTPSSFNIYNNSKMLMVSSSARPPSSPSIRNTTIEKGGASKRRAAPGPLLHLHDSIASPRRGQTNPPQLVALGGRKLRSPSSQT